MFVNYFLLAIILLGVTYLYSRPGMMIKKATRDLISNDVTEESAADYLSILNKVKRVPNYKEYWQTCQTGYNLVKDSPVTPELKEKIRQAMLRLGVSGI